MARRNIFDRDTGAGYYSDALGNFLENIPSLYGQIAKEKRLEKQRIEDTNYRNQAYNDSLMQQAKTNIRLAESDKLTRDKFDQKVKNDEFTQAYQIAEAYYNATGDYSRLAQVEQQYSPETYDANKYDKIKAGTTDRQTFDANYLDWDSLSSDEKYARGNELKDLISQSSMLMKTGDSRNKINYQNINKVLRNEFKTYKKNSGQLVKDKDLWSGQKGQYGLKSYESNERGIKSVENQITDLQSKVNEIIPQDKATVENPTTLKELGYRDRQIREINILNGRIENFKIKKAKLMDKNLEITNDFRYPIFNIDPTGEDYALEGMKSERPVEQETNITENNQEKLEKMDADILSSVGDLDDAKIDEFMSVLNSENPEDLNNYLFGFEEGGDDLADGEPAPKPIQTNLAEVETGDKTEQPVVAEIKTEDNVDVSDTIEETIDKDIDVVDVVDEVPEPDQGAGSILSGLPIGTLSAGGTKPIVAPKPVKDLFSEEEVVKPPTEEGSRRREIDEKILKKQDKSYEEGFSKYNEIQDSNIRDIDGKKINFDSIGKFNKQVNSMVKKVKNLQMKSGLSISPQARLKERQDVLEQKQIVEDLLELKDRISDLPKYIYKNRVVKGRETGEISKIDTKRFKQSIDNALKGNKYTKGLTKNIRYKDEFTPLKESRYKQALGY